MLVLGSGAAGLRTAVELARRNVKVVVTTSHLFGGTSACSGSDKQTLHTARTIVVQCEKGFQITEQDVRTGLDLSGIFFEKDWGAYLSGHVYDSAQLWKGHFGGQMNIKPKNECKYDLVSLGEVMLRLDPGNGRMRQLRSGPWSSCNDNSGRHNDGNTG